VATHDLSCVAANFDHAVLLNRRVVAFGRPAEVFTEELLSAAFQRHLLVLPGGERTLVGP
jgi:ABC-type Mn2+/Zn2+ transport system ATPase subunit